MSVPARKKPKSKTLKGRSHHALKPAKIVACEAAGGRLLPHRVCQLLEKHKGHAAVKKLAGVVEEAKPTPAKTKAKKTKKEPTAKTKN